MKWLSSERSSNSKCNEFERTHTQAQRGTRTYFQRAKEHTKRFLSPSSHYTHNAFNRLLDEARTQFLLLEFFVVGPLQTVFFECVFVCYPLIRVQLPFTGSGDTRLYSHAHAETHTHASRQQNTEKEQTDSLDECAHFIPLDQHIRCIHSFCVRFVFIVFFCLPACL